MQEPIVQPMIDELKKNQKPRPAPMPEGLPEPEPTEPAALDQDAGGGYNPDGTYPQT